MANLRGNGAGESGVSPLRRGAADKHSGSSAHPSAWSLRSLGTTCGLSHCQSVSFLGYLRPP